MDDASVSHWHSTAREGVVGAALNGDVEVDLAVVGGGYTGLSTALHAAQGGRTVQVLEAEHLGFGGSGRNAGLVNAGVWYPPAKVRKLLGPEYGPRFVAEFGNGPEMVFTLIERHQIQCDATREGTIHAAHAASGFADLQARHAEWARLGAPVRLLSKAEMVAATGSAAFHGGLLDQRAGTINPMGYCRGLARAAQAAGARISTGVRVSALRRDGALWRVRTAAGPEVRARSVVLCTNAYTDALWPGLARAFTPIHYFQLATEPLGARIAAVLPGRQGLWDTAPIMFSLRRDREDRLIIGSMGSVLPRVSERWAAKKLARLFPDLGPVRFETSWHGRIAMTPDHLPRIVRLAEGLYTPIGYNGRGITTGTIFGKAMAQIVAGGDAGSLPLPVTDLSRVARAPVMQRAYHLAFTANQLLRSL